MTVIYLRLICAKKLPISNIYHITMKLMCTAELTRRKKKQQKKINPPCLTCYECKKAHTFYDLLSHHILI